MINPKDPAYPHAYNIVTEFWDKKTGDHKEEIRTEYHKGLSIELEIASRILAAEIIGNSNMGHYVTKDDLPEIIKSSLDCARKLIEEASK